MKKIAIGTTARNRKVLIDLDLLLISRLLVQASSGGGKSWLVRLIAEQTSELVQTIVIDPEGEFASLREKCDFILVGKGGEAPVDIRSAETVAHKILELGVSVVCDLYDCKKPVRLEWVRRFCEALMEAPKKWRRPRVVIFDEAHMFAPEGQKSGKNPCLAAVSDLVTRGRKQGYCPIMVTQRLSKLSKDCAAELQNVMIGSTIMDIDLRRAAIALGIESRSYHQFCKEIRGLKPGEFYGLGMAISRDRVLFKVGAVKTSHPKLGKRVTETVPPIPKGIKKLLPQLEDLPKQAEEKARTISEFQSEIRSLKAQLRAKPTGETKTVTETIEVPVRDKKLVAAVQQALVKFESVRQALGGSQATLTDSESTLSEELRQYDERVEKAQAAKPTVSKKSPQAVPAKSPPGLPTMVPPMQVVGPPRGVDSTNGEFKMTPRRQGIIQALVEFECVNVCPVPRKWLAPRAGARWSSSAYTNNLSALKTSGFIEYGPNSTVQVSSLGRLHATPVMEMTTESLLESCLKAFTNKQCLILKRLHEVHPQEVSRSDLAPQVDASATSSAYTNNLSALRSAGMIDYGPGSTVRCCDWLFVD